MGQKSDEIRDHIEATRGALDHDLRVLSRRAKPRNIYRAHPRKVLGAALGSGALLAWLVTSALRRGRAA